MKNRVTKILEIKKGDVKSNVSEQDIKMEDLQTPLIEAKINDNKNKS